MSSGVPSQPEAARSRAQHSSSGPSFERIGIKNTNINTGPGVELSQRQRVIVGSVLDLFAGNPTLRHLSLWSRNATFTDPLTVATGYDRFAAQWYGLVALFRPIELQSHTVTSAADPIEVQVVNRYVLRGLGKAQVIESVVRIFTGSGGGEDDGKIVRVEDRWNGKLPDGAISEAFRKLNAVTVPAFVKVPKTEEEDRKMKEEREGQK